jgi:hypothetical protein
MLFEALYGNLISSPKPMERIFNNYKLSLEDLMVGVMRLAIIRNELSYMSIER